MQWRRGLLLAGIHLAIAVPLILVLQARDAEYLRDRERGALLVSFQKKPAAGPDADSPERSIELNPCSLWPHYPVAHVVVTAANLPAVALTGWRMDCPAPWTLSGRLHIDGIHGITGSWIVAERRVDIGLGIAVVALWLLVGSFPLIRPKVWWVEPGICITACAAMRGALALVPMMGEIAQFSALLAFLGWYWWMGLCIWKPVRFLLRVATRRMVAHA